MVLIEKYVRKVLFIRVFPKPQSRIIDVIVMIVKYHLSPEEEVKHKGIRNNPRRAHCISKLIISRQEYPGECYECQWDKICVCIPVHSPPEAVAEAVIKLLPLASDALTGRVCIYKNSAEYSAEKRRQHRQLQILLHSEKIMFKHSISMLRQYLFYKLKQIAAGEFYTRDSCFLGTFYIAVRVANHDRSLLVDIEIPAGILHKL